MEATCQDENKRFEAAAGFSPAAVEPDAWLHSRTGCTQDPPAHSQIQDGQQIPRQAHAVRSPATRSSGEGSLSTPAFRSDGETEKREGPLSRCIPWSLP